jgi:biopolymer transport protein ExbB
VSWLRAARRRCVSAFPLAFAFCRSLNRQPLNTPSWSNPTAKTFCAAMDGLIIAALVLTSITSLTFIIERGLALRWKRVVPPEVEDAVERCVHQTDVPTLRQACSANPSALSSLIVTAVDHLDSPRDEAIDALETRARREVTGLERGLVVLEIATGIAPLMGLVGTVYGLIKLFNAMKVKGISDNADFASGIAIALNATLIGLLVAIPSLIAWSYYSKKVETLTVEMETICDELLRRLYRRKPKT